VKQLCADDSAATSVKVGYRQASYKEKAPSGDPVGAFLRSVPSWGFLLVFVPPKASSAGNRAA
jgi:hypothetical protein